MGKILGVIGGLGPLATAYFLELVTQMTAARTDQEHIEILIHSKPGIPDRTRYILGKSDRSPLPYMEAVGKQLAAQGAELLAIPCITAHYFQRELEETVGVPILNAIEETAGYLRREQITRVGVMATDGTVESGLFQRVLGEQGIQVVLPDAGGQAAVMHLIYENVKAGRPIELSLCRQITDQLTGAGAQVILLGCTELSVIKKDHPGELLRMGQFLDVMEVLARRAVQCCGELKPAYDRLLQR